MGAMASQITGVSIIYPTIYSGADQRKKSKLCVTGFCEGNSSVTGEFLTGESSCIIISWWQTFLIIYYIAYQY